MNRNEQIMLSAVNFILSLLAILELVLIGDYTIACAVVAMTVVIMVRLVIEACRPHIEAEPAPLPPADIDEQKLVQEARRYKVEKAVEAAGLKVWRFERCYKNGSTNDNNAFEPQPAA